MAVACFSFQPFTLAGMAADNSEGRSGRTGNCLVSAAHPETDANIANDKDKKRLLVEILEINNTILDYRLRRIVGILKA